MRFFLVIFFVYVGLLSACNHSDREYYENSQNISSLQTAVEKKITLDSTVIGVSTVISGLNVPWEIAWGPDNWIWFTEQSGRVSKVNPATGEKVILLEIADVFRERSTGLLGMVIHPDTEHFPYVFVNYTYKEGDFILSKLVRYNYNGDILNEPLVLLEVPGNTGHNGSRVTIAPDGKIIWATGDAAHSDNAQNVHSQNGKTLRLNIDGTIPEDNPFPGSAVWSWGHRNHQGLVYGLNSTLYTSEHGNATDDEINLIRKGGNYGWPEVTGYYDLPEEKAYHKDSVIVEPLKTWTPTIAPAGIDYYNSTAIPEWKNAILLATLKENDLRVLKLNDKGNAIISEEIYFDHEFGRLRDICVSPGGDIYISTSNRDWNPGEGFPKKNDDRIIRIFTIDKSNKILNGKKQIIAEESPNTTASAGQLIYNQYCASCHKRDGNGVTGTFPPLRGAQQVLGDKKELVQIVLDGLSGPIKVKGEEYNQAMPAFDFLTDKEIAEVLTFIRSQFDNGAGSITSQEVSDVRKSSK